MHNEATPTVETGPGYETSDIKISLVVWTLIATFLMLFVSIGLMLVMLRSWEGGAMDSTPLTVSPSQQTTTAARIVAETDQQPTWDTEVRLQALPDFDFEGFENGQLQKKLYYTWANEEAGIAQIPVSVALDKVAAEGLPTWPEFAPDVTEPAAETAEPAPAEAPAPAEEAPAAP